MDVSQELKHPALVIAIILFIYPLSGMGIDIYMPSMPSMAPYFHASGGLIKLSISLYVFGYALFSFVIPPLSDSFGRRLFLLTALILFALLSFAIALSNNISSVLFFRFLQGVCMASILGVLRTVVPDLFSGQIYKKVTGYCVSAWGISAIVAPCVGGNLQHYFNWQSCFYFLGIYTIISVILAALFLPESHTDRAPWSTIKMLSHLWGVMKYPPFFAMSIICGLCYSSFLLFNIFGPFAIQDGLGYSARFYGYVALVMGFAFSIGTVLYRFLCHLGDLKILKIFIGIYMMTALVFLVVAWYVHMSLLLITLPALLIVMTAGVIFPTVYGHCLNLFRQQSGVASAALGGYLLMTSGFLSFIAAIIVKTHASPYLEMMIFYALMAILIQVLFMCAKREL